MIVSKKNIVKSLLQRRTWLQNRIKQAESELDHVNDRLKRYASKNGFQDAKGSFNYQYGSFVIQNQARRTYDVDKEALALITQTNKALDNYAEKKITKASIERALADGVISKKEAKALLKEKVSYSISVREVKEAPDDEEQYYSEEE